MSGGEPGAVSASENLARWASAYYQASWTSVIPLRTGTKIISDPGLTGAEGRDLSEVEALSIIQQRPGFGNLALRLPDGVIGLDVDAYGGKNGAETVLLLECGFPGEPEGALGPRPPTWKSSSRAGDSESGIHLYRVPPGIRWFGEAGEHVDIIQRSHRYMVVAP